MSLLGLCQSDSRCLSSTHGDINGTCSSVAFCSTLQQLTEPILQDQAGLRRCQGAASASDPTRFAALAQCTLDGMVGMGEPLCWH